MSDNDKQDFEEAPAELEASHTEASTDDATPPPQAKNAPHSDFVPPIGTQSLLDAQLGEALKIMRDFADWVHQPHSYIGPSLEVSDCLGRLMTASATLANANARLKEGAPETRQRVIVEHAHPAARRREGEGSMKTQNE